MLDVKVDLLKNRLYLTIGRLQQNSLEKSFTAIENAVKKLTSGFTCITRIIEVRDVDEKDIENIEKIQKLLADYGLAKAVRLGSEQGTQILTFPRKDMGYTATTARTMAEAEKILDQWQASQADRPKTRPVR
ncbi:MAG: hypothetical protein ACQERN_08745 [Thermodesulfobacteriota bacterium]